MVVMAVQETFGPDMDRLRQQARSIAVERYVPPAA
jgi:hypothetical protein